MLHKDILKKFKQLIYISDDEIAEWYPNGRNSIRVQLRKGYQLILTFDSNKHWCLETYASYVDRLEKEAQMMRKITKS